MSDAMVDRQAMDTIARYHALRGNLPDVQKLADKFEVTTDQAIRWIESYKVPAGAEVATKPDPVKPKKEPEPVSEVKKEHGSVQSFMNKLIDSGSLWFAVVIDLILNGVGFYIIGPDPLMKVGMVCVSVIVVLFSVRAWIKHDKLLWAMFALVASFMDISFILLATDVQTINQSRDTELDRLEGQAKKAQEYLEALQALQLERGQGYKDQIREATVARDTANKAVLDHRSAPKQNDVQMTASKVFTAIPDAIMSGRWDRWIALAILTLVFAGLQLTIISATGVKWRYT